mgnify:CR=1 FL=1
MLLWKVTTKGLFLMASLKDIKRRIVSVKSTQKITNAMKLVSASKFAKASHAVQSSRPYSDNFAVMVKRVVGSLGSNFSSSFTDVKEEKKSLLVVVGSDRGLCGGLNTNLFKYTDKFLAEKRRAGVEMVLWGWGKRSIIYSKGLPEESLIGKEKVLAKPQYEDSAKLGLDLAARYTESYDRVYLCFPRFKSVIEQIPTVKQLLPVEPVSDVIGSSGSTDIIVEPSGRAMVEGMLQQLLNVQVHSFLLESAASEHGARMSAMDNATNNAKEVTKKLTLQYNRARQAAITKELMEIIGGAEALN